MLRGILFLMTLLCLISQPQRLLAHGSVTAEDDLCIIHIGFYRAHFSIFQPLASGQKEYCEDIPRIGESIFVMEYLHAALGDIPIDFRIIRDVTGLGRFARVSDLETIVDIEAATVFYRPPQREPGVYTVLHEFEEAGEFLGIVTVEHPETGEIYKAVFPFEVGFTGWGLLPFFAVLAVLIQLGYWYANRGRPQRVSILQ